MLVKLCRFLVLLKTFIKQANKVGETLLPKGATDEIESQKNCTP